MSALIASHVPDTTRTTLTLPVEMLRKNDVILSGVGIDEPVTITQITVPKHDTGRRELVLITSENQIYFREYGIAVEVTIQN